MQIIFGFITKKDWLRGASQIYYDIPITLAAFLMIQALPSQFGANLSGKLAYLIPNSLTVIFHEQTPCIYIR